MEIARSARTLLRGVAGIAAALAVTSALAADPIKIGLVAALSGPSAQSGEAITQGLTIAIDEINAGGGVLGRPLALVKRDDESSPPKGATAARELVYDEKVAAIFGGLDTPVSLAIVPIANKEHVPYMGVWAAGTPITRNGANPNYAFRVSAVDVMVDEALHQIDEYHGLIKTYRKPFSAQNQDALGPDDYIFVRYSGNKIVPVH
jgi:branched-chain amino acid transport system substrate-binding protein